MVTKIGELKESSLHARLKELYSRPDDLVEVKVGDSIIDIVRGDLLIEIQTGRFSALKEKLIKYLSDRPMRIVYPIAIKKNIMRIANNNNIISYRKSPKKGRIEDLFNELVGIALYVNNPNFSLEIALIEEDVIWINDGKGSWRRNRWSIADKRLINLFGYKLFKNTSDYIGLLPHELQDDFTTLDLTQLMGMKSRLANKMIYCLKVMGGVEKIGKKGRYNLYKKIQV